MPLSKLREAGKEELTLTLPVTSPTGTQLGELEARLGGRAALEALHAEGKKIQKNRASLQGLLTDAACRADDAALRKFMQEGADPRHKDVWGAPR